MNDTVYVEPADRHRRGFARWCLSQDPKIMTSSATGSDVPRDLFADIPLDLLDGAKVDGHIFRPVLDGYVAVPAGGRQDAAQAPADVVPVQDGPKPEAVAQTAAQAPSRPRKRTAPKRTPKADS